MVRGLGTATGGLQTAGNGTSLQRDFSADRRQVRSPTVQFPSLKARRVLAILCREPLAYEVVRQQGSHRRLRSRNGYPPLTFSFHDGVTVPPRTLRKILVDDVGLSEPDALDLT